MCFKQSKGKGTRNLLNCIVLNNKVDIIGRVLKRIGHAKNIGN